MNIEYSLNNLSNLNLLFYRSFNIGQVYFLNEQIYIENQKFLRKKKNLIITEWRHSNIKT